MGRNNPTNKILREIAVPCSIKTYLYQLAVGKVFVANEPMTRTEALELLLPEGFDSILVTLLSEDEETENTQAYLIFDESQIAASYKLNFIYSPTRSSPNHKDASCRVCMSPVVVTYCTKDDKFLC